jgi:hypothetical protein
MTTLNPARLISFAVLLLALAATTITARAEVGTAASGNIVDHYITAATIDPVTSFAAVKGTIQCSVPTVIMVQPSVRQLRGLSDHFAQYYRRRLRDVRHHAYAVQCDGHARL